MMFTIYHNTRCKVSREGLSILKESGVELKIVDYLKTPFTPSELKKLLMKLNMKPLDIVRTNENLFKKKLKGRKFTDDEWIKILIENPVLIERPIVEREHKAVIGRPVENILELLKNKTTIFSSLRKPK